MKPEWKDAPEWANYLAQDSDRSWHWYEDRPTIAFGEAFVSNGRYERVLDAADWQESLEERP